MDSREEITSYVAFLRGINVGGHHKVPMADLRKELTGMGLQDVATLLNSGNVLFATDAGDREELEASIASRLEVAFGFPIPTLIRTADTIRKLYAADPFQDVPLTTDIRWYVSFCKADPPPALALPWVSTDGSFTIIERRGSAILSVLDLSLANTPKAMEALERYYGTGITTRNWKTIERIVKKL